MARRRAIAAIKSFVVAAVVMAGVSGVPRAGREAALSLFSSAPRPMPPAKVNAPMRECEPK